MACLWALRCCCARGWFTYCGHYLLLWLLAFAAAAAALGVVVGVGRRGRVSAPWRRPSPRAAQTGPSPPHPGLRSRSPSLAAEMGRRGCALPSPPPPCLPPLLKRCANWAAYRLPRSLPPAALVACRRRNHFPLRCSSSSSSSNSSSSCNNKPGRRHMRAQAGGLLQVVRESLRASRHLGAGGQAPPLQQQQQLETALVPQAAA